MKLHIPVKDEIDEKILKAVGKKIRVGQFCHLVL